MGYKGAFIGLCVLNWAKFYLTRRVKIGYNVCDGYCVFDFAFCDAGGVLDFCLEAYTAQNPGDADIKSRFAAGWFFSYLGRITPDRPLTAI